MRGVLRGTQLLVAALLLAGAGAATAVAISLQGAYPTAFPEDVRAVGGGPDPYLALPKPVECDPARNRPGRRDYFPLSRLKRARVDDPFVLGEQFTARLELKNRKRQRFYIYVSAGSQAPVDRFIATASVCLERFVVRAHVPQFLEQVYFDQLLVASAVQLTGLGQAALSSVRDGLVAAGPASLAAVLATRNVDPLSVVDAAATAADAQLAAKVAAGELDPAEVAALDTRDVMTRLVDEPGAPFLYSPAELPRSPAERGAFLKRDPKRRRSIGMESVDESPKLTYVVWFAFDPAIGNGEIDNYTARKRLSVKAWIQALAGSAAVKLWRVSPAHTYGTRTAVAPNLSSTLAGSYTTTRTYDVNVTGKQNNSDYDIYGGWVCSLGSC